MQRVMRRRPTLAIALTLVVLGVAFQAAPASAAHASKSETYVVDTRHGEIYLEVVRPVDEAGATVEAPAIFTLSPYSVLGRNGDANRWVPRG